MQRKKAIIVVASVIAFAAVLGSIMFSEKQQEIVSLTSSPLPPAPKTSPNNDISTETSVETVTLSLNRLFADASSKKLNIVAAVEGEEKKFAFHLIKEGDFTRLIAEEGQGAYLTDIANTSQAIMQYEYNLYLVDYEQMTIEPLLKDEIGVYSKAALYNENIDGLGPDWASSPNVSSDGKKMIFYTNRNAVVDGNYNGQMWVKYLPDGEEYMFFEEGFSFIGFGNDEEVYYISENQIKAVSLITKSSRTIVDYCIRAWIAGGYLFYQPEYKRLFMKDLLSEEEKEVPFTNIGNITHVLGYGNHPWVIINNQPERTEALRQHIVYNVDTEQYKYIEAPADNILSMLYWLDDKLLLASIGKHGTLFERKYMISFADLL